MKNTSENEFENETAQGFALVDFYGQGCTNCKMLEPTLDRLEKEFANSNIKFLKLDTAGTPSLNKRFAVATLPTLVLLKDGEPVQTLVGLKPQGVLVRAIKESFGV